MVPVKPLNVSVVLLMPEQTVLLELKLPPTLAVTHVLTDKVAALDDMTDVQLLLISHRYL